MVCLSDLQPDTSQVVRVCCGDRRGRVWPTGLAQEAMLEWADKVDGANMCNITDKGSQQGDRMDLSEVCALWPEL